MFLSTAFSDWIGQREIRFLGTNTGAPTLPFQHWHHFKEAFAPELVAYAVEQCNRHVARCLDPFGGSGTTALTCQFLGIHPTTMEVNPFLADLIEAKLAGYDCDSLAKELGQIINRAQTRKVDVEAVFGLLPKTFIEPGHAGRWIFDRSVAERLAAYRATINDIERKGQRRLFNVLLGGILNLVSNVVVSGKGRRYRRDWHGMDRDPNQVDRLFSTAGSQAIAEIYRYANRAYRGYEVRCGDCRQLIAKSEECDLAVFSPPYPNSFDYTDIYNIQLWMLGYLTDWAGNRLLREATLSSHVQVAREYAPAPKSSAGLKEVLESLDAVRTRLWNPRLPEMVGAYFADMALVLGHISRILSKDGEIWMVVGDSQYHRIRIRTATILGELSPDLGYQVKRCEPFRSMRSSAQQGGRLSLDETLLVLRKSI